MGTNLATRLAYQTVAPAILRIIIRSLPLPPPPILDYDSGQHPRPSWITQCYDALRPWISRWPVLLPASLYAFVWPELNNRGLDSVGFTFLDVYAVALFIAAVADIWRRALAPCKVLTKAAVCGVLFVACWASTSICFGSSQSGDYLLIRPWPKLITLRGGIGFPPGEMHSLVGKSVGGYFSTYGARAQDFE